MIIGEHANSYHSDRDEIGERNWQWWEIEKTSEEDNGFIAVNIDPSNDWPTPLYGKGAEVFTQILTTAAALWVLAQLIDGGDQTYRKADCCPIAIVTTILSVFVYVLKSLCCEAYPSHYLVAGAGRFPSFTSRRRVAA